MARLTSAQLRLSIWWLPVVVAAQALGLAVVVLAAIVQPQGLQLLAVRLTQSQSAVVAILVMALILYFLP